MDRNASPVLHGYDKDGVSTIRRLWCSCARRREVSMLTTKRFRCTELFFQPKRVHRRKFLHFWWQLLLLQEVLFFS